MVTHGTGFRQVHAAQHLGANHFHLAIGLDQQACIGGQSRQGLLTQQLGVGSLAGGPLRNQGSSNSSRQQRIEMPTVGT